MGHYKSNVRDIEFNLFEVFDRQRIMGHAPYEEMDEDTARSVLSEVDRMATGLLAESFADADRNPPVFDPADHTVKVPEGFKQGFQAFMDAGWFAVDLESSFGGFGAPRSLAWAVSEMVLGANPAMYIYASGPSFAQTLWKIGTPEQKRFAELALERKWGATMVLTEPDAGSDVGAGRTKAIDAGDGTWHIEGVKRFITSAEHDLSENIFHLVLARPEGAGPGTKGLSMFLVPKYLVNEDGSLGKRNGAYVTNVEHKMGLKVSTTCELTFGEQEPAVGYLVGGVHEGIKQMFLIIEHARMMVGTKAIATLSTGYLNALDFAKERVQGGDLAEMTNKAAPRVTITHHPDVRRSLMLQKSYAEGMRALVLYTATFQDAVRIGAANGTPDDAAERMNDLLLPLVKGVGSERSYELLAQSLQTLGGSGFLQDYPVEQYIRDSKIDTLYEGTTAIQGQDLFFRKIVKNNGATLTVLHDQIKAFAAGDGGWGHLPSRNGAEPGTAVDRDGGGRLKDARAALDRAADDVKAIVDAMVGDLMNAVENNREIYKVGLNTTRLLLALGDLVIAWLLQRQAEIALAKLDAGATGADQAFYTGKVAAARFFAANVLPRLATERAIAESTTLDVMDVPEEAF